MKDNENTMEKKSPTFENRNISIRLAITALTAALYVALGLIFQPISFLGIQFRIAELIVGMIIIFPWEGLIGNVLGVFIVNLFSPLGPIDLVSAAVNIPALYCILLFRNRKYLKYAGGLLYSIIISLWVAIMLYLILLFPIIIMFIQVFISEIILASLGILLFTLIGRALKLNEKNFLSTKTS